MTSLNVPALPRRGHGSRRQPGRSPALVTFTTRPQREMPIWIRPVVRRHYDSYITIWQLGQSWHVRRGRHKHANSSKFSQPSFQDAAAVLRPRCPTQTGICAPLEPQRGYMVGTRSMWRCDKTLCHRDVGSPFWLRYKRKKWVQCFRKKTGLWWFSCDIFINILVLGTEVKRKGRNTCPPVFY